VTLRDVLFLAHPKPQDEAQAQIWKRLAADELKTPDTWETSLSAGADKKETFTRLIENGKLGYFALLRNLRNMAQAGVDERLVTNAIIERRSGAEKVLPFRYIAAARACPQFEPSLDIALQAAIKELPALDGRTVVLVDVSVSMDQKLSAKSDLKRVDAACALASVLHCEHLRMFSFSSLLIEVAPRRGMAGVDALLNSQTHHNTHLADAVNFVNAKVPHDRLIVITDEQATDGPVPDPIAPLSYMINVASAQNGVGYGKWVHLDGFSEGVIKWIYARERAESGVNRVVG